MLFAYRAAECIDSSVMNVTPQMAGYQHPRADLIVARTSYHALVIRDGEIFL